MPELTHEQCAPPPRAPPLVAKQVVGYGTQPPAWVIRNRTPLVKSHERLLRKVCRQIGVAAQPLEISKEGSKVRIEEPLYLSSERGFSVRHRYMERARSAWCDIDESVPS